MISNNIDGSIGGATQLFDLLTVVSNPAAYTQKLEALQKATAEHRTYVEALAPAHEIYALRDQTAADRAEAAVVLTTAKSDAAASKAAAKQAADSVTRAAAEAAHRAQESANVLHNAAETDRAAAAALLKDAEIAAAALAAERAQVVEQSQDLQRALVAAVEARAEYEEYRAALQAKVQAFISGL